VEGNEDTDLESAFESASETLEHAYVGAARLRHAVRSFLAQFILLVSAAVVMSFVALYFIVSPFKLKVASIPTELMPSLSLICLFMSVKSVVLAYQYWASLAELQALLALQFSAIRDAEGSPARGDWR